METRGTIIRSVMREVVAVEQFTCMMVVALACATVHAQYASDFESPLYNGSADGVVLTGQDAFYIPPNTDSVDFLVYTYADNVLGLPTNPGGGGEQFVAGTGPAGGVYARAERDVNFGPAPVHPAPWMITYDVAATFRGQGASLQNLGSFSTQECATPPPEATYIQLASWVDPNDPVDWNAFYLAFDADGNLFAQPGASPGSAWEGLELDHWYRMTTRFDLVCNRITHVCITDLTTSAKATFRPNDWYLGGGEAGGLPAPTGFRFFAGGGVAGNTLAFDNLRIVSGCFGDLDCDGDTDESDLGILLAAWETDSSGDLDCDGDTDQSDLGTLLSDWGCEGGI